nr:YolD-like family protein [Clostridia bacterium]
MDNVWIYGYMPLSQRAKLFQPFAALRGFEELIREQENAYDEMPELSDDQYEDLNYAVSSIRIGDDVTVKYFRNYHIRSVFGSVTKLELQKREIWIDRKRIAFEELIEITL